MSHVQKTRGEIVHISSNTEKKRKKKTQVELLELKTAVWDEEYIRWD